MKVYVVTKNNVLDIEEGFTDSQKAVDYIKMKIVGRNALLSENGWQAKYVDCTDSQEVIYKIRTLNVK